MSVSGHARTEIARQLKFEASRKPRELPWHSNTHYYTTTNKQQKVTQSRSVAQNTEYLLSMNKIQICLMTA